MNEKLIEFYGLLKDKGLTDSQIDAAFQEHTGMSLSEVRQRLSPQAPGGAEIVQEATEGAYTEPDIDEGEKIWQVAQTALQGATFGTADEMEAGIRSAYYGTDYDTELQNVRDSIKSFQENNPGMATAAELGGAFLVPGMMISKLAKYLPMARPKEGQWFFNTLRRMGIGAAAGATEGLAYGTGTAEPDPDASIVESLGQRIDQAIPQARTGAAIGMITGPTVGKASEMFGEWITKKVGGAGGKGPPPIDADGNITGDGGSRRSAFEGRQLMVRAAELDDVQLEDIAELLEEIARKNPELAQKVTVADLFPESGTGQMLAEVATQAAGPSKAASESVYKSRSRFLPGFARDSIKKNLGRRWNPDRLKEKIEAQSKAKAQPLYDKASPILLDTKQSRTLNDHVNRILDYGDEDPGAKALQELWNQARVRIPGVLRANNIGPPMAGASTFGERPSGQATIAHWHTLKVLIGDKLKQKKRSSDPYSKFDESTLQRLYDDISKTLKSASEDYQIASRIHAGHKGMSEAFDAGLKAQKDPTFPSTDLQRELRNQKSVPEQKAYRLGYAFGMYNKIMGGKMKQMDVKKTLGMFADEEPEKIRALFKSEKKAEEFLQQIDFLSKMDALSKRATSGSQTYARQSAERMIKGSPALTTQAIDLYNKTRGVNPLMTSTDDILSNQRFQEKLGTLGPMMNTQGVQQNRKIIQQGIAERERLRKMMEARAGYSAMTPGMMSPLLGNEYVAPIGSLLSPDTYMP